MNFILFTRYMDKKKRPTWLRKKQIVKFIKLKCVKIL